MELKYEHWKEVPRTYAARSWKFFQPKAMARRGTGKLQIDNRLLGNLDLLRGRFGDPLTVLSVYRSAYHNSCVRGAIRSKHIFGNAGDISICNKDK
tara:strand:- start:3625 stop:3912 length:288 start_codon:yes stop_codon:yes gene_type:complete